MEHHCVNSLMNSLLNVIEALAAGKFLQTNQRNRREEFDLGIQNPQIQFTTLSKGDEHLSS